MRISDWSSDVCSSDLQLHQAGAHYRSSRERAGPPGLNARTRSERRWRRRLWVRACCLYLAWGRGTQSFNYRDSSPLFEWLVRHREMINQHRTWAIEWWLLGEDEAGPNDRSEEHTSEFQSIMRISYAVF